ncbi:T9SS type A sorting domain-containing protein [Aureisphaera galaxeae]|uniref:T9SS type A sorting domain-containing protein n=1 Tax=Aureisphaera galaxeae TaxID=1538023 RepID=UPI0023501B85|nr:T9SS type A sorting domain-containing protein [Aureisphaera galaxeae]MDC8003286.1 T9SS type A sorting domain-containing protein [Aureisphaera galaxeae]
MKAFLSNLALAILFFGVFNNGNITAQTQIGSDINGDPSQDDLFGGAISMNSDGTRLAVGAIGNDGGGDGRGEVRVFDLEDGEWIQIGGDINGLSDNDNLGNSVSLNADGSVLAIGAQTSDVNGTNSGRVVVFELIGSNWVQLGSTLNGPIAGDLFGCSVSLSGDGNTMAIGARGNDDNGLSTGEVKVFEFSGGEWVQKGQDINGEEIVDGFGNTVSLSDDGTRFASGSWFHDGNGVSSGRARVFEYQGANWVQVGNDINGEAASDLSGHWVSLSGNGQAIAVGAVGNDGNGSSSGHVRVYNDINGGWLKIGDDIDGENEFDQSGNPAVLNYNGSIVAIGAQFNETNGENSGHVRVFQNMGDSWVQLGMSIEGEVNEQTGRSISLRDNGNTVAVGGYYSDESGNYSDHVRVYDLSDLVNSPPVAMCQDIVIQLDDNGEASIDGMSINNGSSDPDGDDITFSVSPSSFNCSDIGANSVTLTVMDTAGNTDSCSAVVTIEDSISPTAICQNITIELDENGQATLEPMDVDAGSFDNCSFNVAIDQSDFDCSHLGANTINFTITDGSGNAASCSAEINVVDNTAPIFDVSSLPEDQIRNVNTSGEYVLEDFTLEVSVADNCTQSGGIEINQNPVPGTVLTINTYQVDILALDGNGNEVSHSFTLEVDEALGLSDLENLSQVVLFTNPVKSNLIVHNPKNEQLDSIAIYDMLGRKVAYFKITEGSYSYTFDLNSLESASYLLVVESGLNSIVKQLIKN